MCGATCAQALHYRSRAFVYRLVSRGSVQAALDREACAGVVLMWRGRVADSLISLATVEPHGVIGTGEEEGGQCWAQWVALPYAESQCCLDAACLRCVPGRGPSRCLGATVSVFAGFVCLARGGWAGREGGRPKYIGILYTLTLRTSQRGHLKLSLV